MSISSISKTASRGGAKLVRVLLALVMVVGLMPAFVHAQSTPAYADDAPATSYIKVTNIDTTSEAGYATVTYEVGLKQTAGQVLIYLDTVNGTTGAAPSVTLPSSFSTYELDNSFIYLQPSGSSVDAGVYEVTAKYALSGDASEFGLALSLASSCYSNPNVTAIYRFDSVEDWDGGSSESDPDVPESGITLDKTSVTLKTGETAQLTATVQPSAEITWSSSDSSVATVDANGMVAGVSCGTATITAAAGELSATCVVEVVPSSNYLNVTDIDYASEPGYVTYTYEIGLMQDVGTLQVRYQTFTGVSMPPVLTLPEGLTSTYSSSYNRFVIKESTGSISAGVYEVKAKFTVTNSSSFKVGLATGSTGCRCQDASYNWLQLAVTEATVPATSITLDQTSATLIAKESLSLKASVEPFLTTDSVVWESSDSSVATVSSTGVVTAVSGGEATITATAGSVSATCKVTVEVIPATDVVISQSKATVTAGQKVKLTASVYPSNTTDSVVWESSDKSVATVSNGIVTAVSEGTATITATAGDKIASCEVTVHSSNIASSYVKVMDVDTTTTAGSAVVTYELGVPDGVAGVNYIAVSPSNTGVGATPSSFTPILWLASSYGLTSSKISLYPSDALTAGTYRFTVTYAVTDADNLGFGFDSSACTFRDTANVTHSFDSLYNWSAEGVSATAVTLNKATATAYVGYGPKLAATVEPVSATEDVIWTSSDESIATVDAYGKVTGVSAGTATITATAGGVSAACKVEVEAVPTESDSNYVKVIDETVTYVASTQRYRHSVTFLVGLSADGPDGGTLYENGLRFYPTVNCASSSAVSTSPYTRTYGSYVCFCDASGDLQQNVQLGSGVYAVTVNYITTSFESPYVGFDVTNTAQLGHFPGGIQSLVDSEGVEQFVAVPATSVTLSQAEATVSAGSKVTLSATVAPTDTTDAVVWSSSDDSIATVDATGKVTGVHYGTATITATAGDVSATCEVTVEALPLSVSVATDPAANLGDAQTFTGTVTNATTTTQLQWWYRTSESGAWKAWSGQTGDTLSQKAWAYRCNGYQVKLVATDGDQVAESEPASFASLEALEIEWDTAPAILAGKYQVFECAATTEGVTFQWQYRTSATGSWRMIAGATSDTYTSKAWAYRCNGYQVRCAVTDPATGRVAYTDAMNFSIENRVSSLSL